MVPVKDDSLELVFEDPTLFQKLPFFENLSTCKAVISLTSGSTVTTVPYPRCHILPQLMVLYLPSTCLLLAVFAEVIPTAKIQQ